MTPGLSSLTDFDLPYAFHDLNRVTIDDERGAWETALWVNFLMGSLAVAIAGLLWVAIRFDVVAQQTSIAARVILWVAGVVLIGAMLLCTLRAFTRCRLVLDRKARSLSFYRFWFSSRPMRSMRIDDIAHLTRRRVDTRISWDEEGHTYKILVAELHDGRMASIAIDSPESIEDELKREMRGTA